MANPVNNCTTFWDPAFRPTGKAIGAAITGSRFTKIVAGGDGAMNPGVANTGANELVCGVAQRDVPQNAYVLINRGGAFGVTAGAALTAGATVYSDATGRAVTGGSANPAGICLADTASGAIAPILLLN